ncbi:hypothetical protein GF373_02415, partial [bacterium]|nr:hypothetical protein [bacterium]
MEPVRMTFWNVPHWAEIAQYVLGGITVLVFCYGVYRHIAKWRKGRAEPLGLDIKRGMNNFISAGLFQKRLYNDTYASLMHLGIFWGMMFLL